MGQPNDTLRAVRLTMCMSQDDFARALQHAGARAGTPVDVSKRTIQRWEAGEVTSPRPVYIRALQALTGLTVESLGFPAGADRLVVEDGRGGHDLAVRALPPSVGPVRAPHGDYSGIWISRYEYYSSGREQAFEGTHMVLLLQNGDQLTVRSLPGSADSTMSMSLVVDGTIVTGTWVEETSSSGYYRGARYHGAIQLLADPTGRRLAGKWIGFGKDSNINTGPWTLTFVDGATDRNAIDRHNHPVE